MIVLNTTYHVEEKVLEDFIKFIKTEFIPVATQSGEMSSPRLSRIMIESEDGGLNYALQFEVAHSEALNSWYESTGNNLNKRLTNTFNDCVMGFSTLMEIVDLQE